MGIETERRKEDNKKSHMLTHGEGGVGMNIGGRCFTSEMFQRCHFLLSYVTGNQLNTSDTTGCFLKIPAAGTKLENTLEGGGGGGGHRP